VLHVKVISAINFSKKEILKSELRNRQSTD